MNPSNNTSHSEDPKGRNTFSTMLDEILEHLDEQLAGVPGTATEIGWEMWAEQKQYYYGQARDAILKRHKEELLAAKREGRVESIDEYLNQCGILRVEPNRQSLQHFQDGQKLALEQLQASNNTEGEDN